ncbi:unnamed protein product [Musa acuminata subsp. malaccensis]|uniref:(wild Malaysian banana) hypothetical protein n=1 Tax=Musa acuminata subsp. malaccensis TaxID=214687 RepID=A0A804I6J9_MUSAM|nr:PREDICTED: transcription factor bHLH83-like [Musa acuminata subsp. malaccensis]CAG1863050.1 unnamed protein product [Musa acuminata subsp. malaccensis]
MALAKDRTRQGPPACPLDGGGPSIQELRLPSSLELFGYLGDGSTLLRDGERSSDSHGSYSSSLLSFHSDPRNSDSCAYNMLGAVISPPQESLSVVASQQSWGCFDTSVLSFDGHLNLDHEEECAAWIDAMDRSYQPNHLDIKRGTADSRLIQEKDCFEVGSGNKRRGQDRFGFIYSGAAAFDDLQESIGQTTVLQKRSSTNSCDVQSPKKQCGTPRRTKDKKSTSPSKDPQQSIAAKNRRERISERLKILQDLVPNGTKVDLVTMLEKAISYVKFLQLQVKVLATDELWPGQGGKPPDVGQVKEAIDAILSSHGDRNSQLRL